TAIRFNTEHAESEWILNTARSILVRDPAATIGVIARSGFRRESVDAAFAAADVPSTRWDLAVENPRILDTLRLAAKGLPASASLDDLETRTLAGVPAA